MLRERNFPLPIGQTRLFTAILMGVASGVFIFLGSTTLELFTLTRQIYFVFGVAAGVLLGVFEARTVISKLAKGTEATVWQIIPVGTALFGAPLLLVIALFGVSEYMPFGIFAFFPFITAAGAASGWYFNRFEKENKVGVFVFYFGFKYWTQPNPDVSDRFYQFLRDVEAKDPSQFWGQVGSSLSYVGYTNAFMNKIKETREIDPARKEKLFKILKTMNRYRKAALASLAFLLLSVATMMILLFGSAFGYIRLNFKIVDVLGPASAVIFFGFIISILGLMRTFQRKITRLLES